MRRAGKILRNLLLHNLQPNHDELCKKTMYFPGLHWNLTWSTDYPVYTYGQKRGQKRSTHWFWLLDLSSCYSLYTPCVATNTI